MDKGLTGGRAGLGSVAGIGLVAGTMEVAVALSFAALLFAGMGPAAYAKGAAFVLLGAMVSNLISSRWSSMPGAVIVPQDTSTAILAATAAPFLVVMDAGAAFATLVTYVAVATVVTGALMWLIGVLRQGGLIRFIPLPVIGGFLGGTGYHLVVGGADVITRGFDWSTAGVAGLVGGSVFALGMLLVLRRWPRPSLVPGSVVAGAVVFFVALWVSGTSMADARAAGLLMESVRTGLGLPFAEFGSADWSVVGAAWGGLATVPLVATLGMLLNVNALEMLQGHDADLDRELRAVGIANVAGGVSAMPAAYHTLGITALGYRVGVRNRGVPVVVAAMCLLAIVIGGPLLSLLPMPVIGGLIMFIGLGFITDWFVDRRRHMTGPEVLLMAAITVAVATLGFLVAVGLGLVASTIIFAVRYAAMDPVRHHATGLEMRSVVDRPAEAVGVLGERGDRILVVQLHGFLFFGTAKLAVERVGRLVSEGDDLEVVILDLERVHGADATGVSVIGKVAAMADRHGVKLVVSSVPASLQGELDAVLGDFQGVEVAQDVDHALELAENLVIGDITSPDSCDLEDVFGPSVWNRLRPHLDRREVEAGEVVIREGEATTGALLVERGRLVTEIPTDRGYRRVRSSGPGAIVGEMSIYRSGGRSARVTAAESSVLWSLDDRAIARIERSDPRLAVDLHRVMAAVMAESVAQGNVAMVALLR
ncbi:MAG TPA: SulP family inorganic anion transporter [Acidimicrobiia bacterium]